MIGKEIFVEVKEKMVKFGDVLKWILVDIWVGWVNVSFLNMVMVEYYGVLMLFN